MSARSRKGVGCLVLGVRMPLCLLLLAFCFSARALDPKGATFDELIFHAQRYGNTREKRRNKETARKELSARGAESLRHLMENIHLENVGIGVLARNLVIELDAQDAAQVLAGFLDAPNAQTRKMAAFFLGLHDTPEYAERVMPLLADDKAAGAAIRTLGKWRAQAAVTNIIPFLKHEREPRRVAAANALGDIGDPGAVPGLIEALDDRFFTVREAAARALARPELNAERALLEALPEAGGPARRQIVRLLGQLKSRPAVPVLERLLRDEDRAVRDDAARALAAIRGI